MKILPVQFTQIKNINTNKQALPLLKSDSVSFSSIGEEKSETSKQAEEFGLKLFDMFQKGGLTSKKIKEVGQKSVPVLEVDNMKNLSKVFGIDASVYNAYTLPLYGEDCKLKKVTMYTPRSGFSPKTIGSLAHEFTHCIQRYKDDTYLGLAPVTNNNLLEARLLNNLSAIVFGGLEQQKFIEMADKFAVYTDLGMDEEEALCSAYNCQNPKEFKQQMKRIFNAIYDNMYEQSKNHPEVIKYNPLRNNPLMLKRTIRKQCMLRARMEQEAYTVQRNVLNKISPGNVPNEIKMAPAFYKLIADTLDF